MQDMWLIHLWVCLKMVDVDVGILPNKHFKKKVLATLPMDLGASELRP